MDGLEKITLDENTPGSKSGLSIKSTEPAPMKKSRKKLIKRSLFVLIPVLVIVLIIFFAIILPAQVVIAQASKTSAQAKIMMDAVKRQDIGSAKSELAKTKTELALTQKDLSALAWTQFIPLAGVYYSDADHLTKAANDGLDAGGIVIDAILPYADVLGLKGQGSFVGGSAEERIQKAVATMDKITPQIPALEAKLKLVEQELSYVNPNRYPEKLGKLEVKSSLAGAKTLVSDSEVALSEARPLLEVLPSLLGEPKEKKYLVLFQNDKELRPTGGFITAYAEFRIEHGVINLDGSEDIYHLDNTLRKKVPAPDLILKYLPLVPYFNLRDSNVSPDFVASMKNFESLYQYSSNKQDFDGIIALDTHVLVKILDILGEVQAGGITYHTKTDSRCNCPQVIYAMEDYSSRPVNYVRAERKDNIGTLLYAIMKKVLSSSPKLYWGPVFQAGINEAAEKHILFYLHDANAQKGIEALNAAGRIKPYDGDYLHINDANFAGAKSNLYVQQNVIQLVTIAGDGSVTKTVHIDYNNPQPASDCNLERGGLCLNGVLRDVVRVYVPKGSELTDSKGSEVKVETKDEFGKSYFEGFVTVRPESKTSVEFTYKLPFKIAKGSPYTLLIQKQPGTDYDTNEKAKKFGWYTLKVNNNKQEFPLKSDKEVKVQL